MFLATLDENISDEVLNTLYESNIRVTTTKAIKNANYPNNKRVLDFEKLVDICLQSAKTWESYDYTVAESDQIRRAIEVQIEKHQNHQFVKDRYIDRLQRFLDSK